MMMLSMKIDNTIRILLVFLFDIFSLCKCLHFLFPSSYFRYCFILSVLYTVYVYLTHITAVAAIFEYFLFQFHFFFLNMMIFKEKEAT